MAHGKRYNAAVKAIPADSEFPVDKAVELVKTAATAKFDESIDIAIRLGVDPRKADQNLRGTVSLPHGAGKKVRVLVVTKTGKEKEALAAGADFAGFDEYIEKIKGGWTDVDVIIATPEVMVDLGKLGKVLGPRGLMPNPKSGTVTTDIVKAVQEVKAGKIEFRTDKAGVVHASVGKASFAKEKLVDNVNAFLSTIMRLKPSTAKGTYVQSITLSSTMGPGITVDANQASAAHV